jgi:hypothetical protein
MMFLRAIYGTSIKLLNINEIAIIIIILGEPQHSNFLMIIAPGLHTRNYHNNFRRATTSYLYDNYIKIPRMNFINNLLDVHKLQRDYYDFGRATTSRFYNNCIKIIHVNFL